MTTYSIASNVERLATSRSGESSNGLVADTSAGGLRCQHRPSWVRAVKLPRGRGTRLARARGCRDTRARDLRFFERSPQDSGPDGTAHNGFYYHFLDMRSGKRAGHCELSPIDTSFLVAGILTAPRISRRHVRRSRDSRARSQAL